MTVEEFAENLKKDIDEFVKTQEQGVKDIEDALEVFHENLNSLPF